MENITEVPADEVARDKVQRLKSVTIKLNFPIKFGSEVIEEIKLRRPYWSEVEHLPANPALKDLGKIAQKCAKVPSSVMKMLDGSDGIRLAEAIGDFLDDGQETENIRSFS